MDKKEVKQVNDVNDIPEETLEMLSDNKGDDDDE